MARIQLDNDYSIAIDDLNWTLIKSVITQPKKGAKPTVNTGKPHNVVLGYFSSLESALLAYANGLERDGLSESTEPVSTAGLQAILLRIERLCKGMRLVETEE